MTVNELVEIIDPCTHVYFVYKSKNGEEFALLHEIGFRRLSEIPYISLKEIEDSNVLKIENYYHDFQEVSVLRIVYGVE